jgi:hypothetical protein
MQLGIHVGRIYKCSVSSNSCRIIFLIDLEFYNRYEQIFVYNLLLHLRCEEVDSHYKPMHGLGAVSATTVSKVPRNRSRRPNQ